MVLSLTVSPNSAFILPVRNESARIGKLLSHYQQLLEGKLLYIVDAFSTDDTVAICRQHSINLTSKLHILRKGNSGTVEDPAWFEWLVSTVRADSYIFLSCSEFIDSSVMHDIAMKAQLGYDLIYYNRRSMLWGTDISAVYSSLADLLLFRTSYFPICRFASRNALETVETKIHDNWLSQVELVRSVFVRDRNLSIIHQKNPSVLNNLFKHVDYANVEASSGSMLLGHYLRLLREIIYLLVLFFTFRLSRACLAELMLRISYRASIVGLILEGYGN
jgi:glycosyltransferase involved in cell wall biosynthesis